LHRFQLPKDMALVQFPMSMGMRLCITRSFGVKPKLELGLRNFVLRNYKYRSLVRCKAYPEPFRRHSRSRVWRTDRQTDRHYGRTDFIVAYTALHYVAWPTRFTCHLPPFTTRIK